MRAAVALAIVVAVLHIIEYNGALNITRNLKIDYQKAITLTTENGFYFSFYDGLAHAPSTFQGMKDIIFDKKSEHPHTINALSRFNIWQEILLGLAYRAFGWLLPLAPYYFYQEGLVLINAIGQGALVYTAVNEGGSIACGIVAALGLFLNRSEISRIYNINCLCLREFWALPVLWIQIFFVVQAMKGKAPSKGFVLSTFFFMLFWQFGSYVLLLQASAVYAVYIFGFVPGGNAQMRRVVDCYLLATMITIAFLVGNWLLVTNLFLSMLVSVRLVLLIPIPASMKRIYRLLFEGFTALVIFVIIRILVKPYADADTHIFEMICARNDWLKRYGGRLCMGEASFNARLYLVMDVFRTIEQVSIDFYKASGVYYGCLLAMCVIAAVHVDRIVLPLFTSSKKIKTSANGGENHGNGKSHAPVTEKKKTQEKQHDRVADKSATTAPADFDARWAFLFIQFILLFLLGYFINRLRAVFGPVMVLMSALALSPNMLAAFRLRIPRIVGHAFIWIHVAFLASKMPCVDIGKSACGIAQHWSQNEADVVEFAHWINNNLNETDAIAGSMNLSGALRALAKTRTIVHPHFEDHDLRLRVQDLYEDLYHCLPPKHAAEKLKALDARYIVIEWKRCLISPYKLDPPRTSCVQGDPNARAEDLLCRRIFFEPKYFQLRFSNGGAALFERMDGTGLTKKFKNFHDKQLWNHVADQCKEKQFCGGRLAEAAMAFDEKMRAKGAGVNLMEIVANRYQDGISKYYQARYKDYNMNQTQGVAELYRQAWVSLPDNPLITKEYLLFLDMVENDKAKAFKVCQQWLKQPPREDLLEYWETRLEVAVGIKDKKPKKAVHMWEELQVKSPRISIMESYWPWFSKVNYTDAIGSKWFKVRNLFWDYNIKVAIQSFSSTSARTVQNNNWTVLYSD
eukprot:GEMP01006742.1.p1 GENE.GEMP01006742.1~~GEMP01006742.1.p1  ORF type:complete len:926 (+),score=172.76 GEMP01006742.1:44-2779(+)